jgi:hypothetical protein
MDSLKPTVKTAIVTLFCSVVRVTLEACGGYECSERDGLFLLVFEGICPALEWALTLQLALHEVSQLQSSQLHR